MSQFIEPEKFKEAIDYLANRNWATHEADRAIAEELYRRWIRNTDTTGDAPRSRDFDLLGIAMSEVFTSLYGEEGAGPRIIIFTFLLEARAGYDGYIDLLHPQD